MNARFFVAFLLNLILVGNTQEIRFRDNAFNPAVDVQLNQINWKKISPSEAIANENEDLKKTFKVFHQNDFDVSDVRRRISLNVKDVVNTMDTKDLDWKNLEACNNELGIWWEDVEKEELYALQMIDSWAKQEGGILEGNVRWPGHYHECIDAKGPRVSGRYCRAYYGFHYYPKPAGVPVNVIKGICFPSVCSELSARILYRTYFDGNHSIPFMTVRCPDKPQWGTLDTIGISISGVLLLLAFVGLVVDIVKRVENKSNSSVPHHNSRLSLTHSMPTQMILSFSPLSNAEKILDSNQRPGTLPVLDGIRFISTTWVILGHTLQMMFYGLDNAIQAKKRMTSDPSFQAIINGTVSVDTFFLLSGLLVAYLGMKHLHRTKGSMNIPLMYLQRYLRLTPLYAFMIMFSMGLYKFFGSGPTWKDYTDGQYEACKDNWWTNLVYINNVYPVTNYCYGVAWYLACDMQFYILAPFFLILLYRWRVIGILSICLVIVGGVITTGVLSSLNEIQPTSIGIGLQLALWFRFVYWSLPEQTYDQKFSTDIYFTPWARINVYMIGMLTGYVLFVTKRKIRMHKAIVVIGWSTAAGWALAVIYGLYEYISATTTMDVDLAAFYNAVNRPVWGVCIAWVIIACSSGYGGPITTFLNWRVFTPLSRLTYSAYMAHLLILYWYGATQEQYLHFSATNFTYTFLGTLVITFLWAFVIALFIEWPFIGLFKAIFSPLTSPKPIIQASENRPQSTEMDKTKPNEELSNPPSYSSDVSENVESGSGNDNDAFVDEKSAITEM